MNGKKEKVTRHKKRLVKIHVPRDKYHFFIAELAEFISQDVFDGITVETEKEVKG